VQGQTVWNGKGHLWFLFGLPTTNHLLTSTHYHQEEGSPDGWLEHGQILCVAKRVQNKKRIPGLACKYWNYQTSQRVGARNSEVQKRENIFVSHFINIIQIFFFTKVASSSQFYLVWGAVPVCFD
jgi:hypothetical protein